MSRTALLLTLALLVPPGAARAEGPRFGGYVKGYAFEHAQDPYALSRAGTRLQLSVWGGSGSPASYYAAVDFQLESRMLGDGEVRRGAAFDVYPVEMYLNLSKGPLELRIGQQFVFWGRTTWVNPTDVLTAWDYENMASEIEDYRIAPPAVRLNWYLVDELMLDLVWVPVFVPSRVPMAAPAEMGGLPVTDLGSDRPAATPGNGELGARLSQAVSSWAFDWSVSAYRGFEKTPVVEVAPVLSDTTPPHPTGFTWQKRWERLTMLGADLAKALGPFVVKAEGAYKRGEDREGTDVTRKNDRLEYVAGIDWTLSQDVSLGAQYIGRTLLAYDRQDELDAWQTLGGAPPFVDAAVTHEASLRLDVKVMEGLGLQALGLYDLTYEDFFVLAFASWDAADALKLYAGTVLFGGADPATPYARQADYSQVFVELKYSF